jgi:hypothetical protein
MAIFEITTLSIGEKEVIYKLWNTEYPEKLSFKTISDLDDYLATLPNVSYYVINLGTLPIERNSIFKPA